MKKLFRIIRLWFERKEARLRAEIARIESEIHYYEKREL